MSEKAKESVSKVKIPVYDNVKKQDIGVAQVTHVANPTQPVVDKTGTIKTTPPTAAK